MDRDAELVEATLFGHRFVDSPELIEDLTTLEKEGAIYARFWDEDAQTFRYYRIQFLPFEIYQYVEAHVAKQEFGQAIACGATFDEALQVISNPQIAERVRSYGNHGRTRLTNGSGIDNRGCAASFYPEEIGALVYGLRRDRYELLPNLGSLDKPSLLVQMVDYFPVIARFMERRGNSRPPYLVQNEYDVQHLLFASVRSVFEDARTEEWTPKHAGASKRIDIVVPSAETVIETKIVRDRAHGDRIADELKIDIESYHVHSACKLLLALVYDPQHFLIDPATLSTELSGHRVKGGSSFEVKVLIRP